MGRSTFYAHFETKEYLLKELCAELFCHVFDAVGNHPDHRHIFQCDESEPVFDHLFRHLLKNDHNILQLPLFAQRKAPRLPDSFWVDHITSTFVETVRWWIRNGMQESPETITEYFYMAV